MNIGRHFTLEELTHSNTATAEGIPNEPGPAELAALRALCAAVLDPLRDALGKPLTINCAYRGPVLNKRVGGVPKSQHLTGQAADLQSPQATVLDLFKLTINLDLPYDQVIYEARSATSKWLHVSHVDGVNRGEIRVAKFGPDGKPQSYPLTSKAEALAMTERVSRSKAVPSPYEEGPDEPAPTAPAAAPRKAPAKKVATSPAARAPKGAQQGATKGAGQSAAKRSAESATQSPKKSAAKKVANEAAKTVAKAIANEAAPKKRGAR